MAKKTSSSVSRFASILNDVEPDQLEKIYNGGASSSKEKSEAKENEHQVQESEQNPERIEEAIQTATGDDLIDLPADKEKEESGKEEKEEVGRVEKKKRGKEEKKKYDVSYKLTTAADKAIFILSNSDEFPVRGKNEMVDYIISKFIEKKNVKDILDRGIKY